MGYRIQMGKPRPRERNTGSIGLRIRFLRLSTTLSGFRASSPGTVPAIACTGGRCAPLIPPFSSSEESSQVASDTLELCPANSGVCSGTSEGPRAGSLRSPWRR